MRTNEYRTSEIFEMTYLFYLGFPHEFDRTDPKRVEMLFFGDVPLIVGKLKDFWDCNTRVDARGLLNAFKELKKSLWIGGTYDPEYYKKKTNEKDNDIRQTDQQKELKTVDSAKRSDDNGVLKGFQQV